MVYRLPWMDEGETGLWHPAFDHLGIAEHREPSLDEVFEWIADGGLIEAHNVAFERCIWTNIMSARFGWIGITLSQWRCSAVKAATHALPRSLEQAGEALGLLQQKDAAGHKLMLKLSKPRKPRKKEREKWLESHTSLSFMPLLWWESPELFSALYTYCRQDVLAEVALSNALPDYSAAEQALYTLDQAINERGFRLDRRAIECALELIAEESQALNTELATLTDGAVTRATQRAKLVRWFASQGLHLADTRKETINQHLQWAQNDDDDDDIPF